MQASALQVRVTEPGLEATPREVALAGARAGAWRRAGRGGTEFARRPEQVGQSGRGTAQHLDVQVSPSRGSCASALCCRPRPLAPLSACHAGNYSLVGVSFSVRLLTGKTFSPSGQHLPPCPISTTPDAPVELGPSRASTGQGNETHATCVPGEAPPAAASLTPKPFLGDTNASGEGNDTITQKLKDKLEKMPPVS